MDPRTIPLLFGSIAGQPNGLVGRMHDAAYAATGIEGRYVSFGTTDLVKVLSAVRDAGFRGVGISMPFKVEVIRLLDQVSLEVERVGACNTVQITSGRLVGHNTDCAGAMAALAEVIDLRLVRSALIAGAGGVARAIAYGLATAGVQVHVGARRPAAAAQLVADLNLAGWTSLDADELGTFDVVVNATPETAGDGSLARAMLRSASCLLDVGFGRLDTPLATAAIQRGMAVAPGWRMLLHQGARQFEIYTGRAAPLEAMSAALEDILT